MAHRPHLAIDIHLQPAQYELLELIEKSPATVIGVGGGRGAAKSGGADRVMLALMIEQPGMVGCIVMRNYDQVRKYHVEPILRDFPVLESYYRKTDSKLRLPVGNTFSECDFSYAESLEDVKRRFRSGNYRYIIIDQAEQFTWEEISEIGLANRSRGGVTPKMVLLFNMGGLGIEALRNRFGPVKKFNENEDPSKYQFLHVFPWDNVEWSRSELERDGLTEDDYYSWSSEIRFEYFTKRSEYGQKLNALDDSTRARDLLGDWNSLEGSYFGRVFDYKATLKESDIAEGIIRPWDARWLGTDWGKTHFCSTHWCGRTLMSPREVKEKLGWTVPRPLNVISTYRELLVNEQTSIQVAKAIISLTPIVEREKLQRYPFSPEQFGERDSEDTVPIIIGREFAKYGMPHPEAADNSRKPGWQLMYALLNNTRIWATPLEARTAEMEAQAGDTAWIISPECPELLNAIPLAMRNIKDLDDVVKTDRSATDKKMDVLDSIRYALQSMLGPGVKPVKVAHAERLMDMWNHNRDPNQMMMAEISFRAQQEKVQEFQVSGRRRR
jgi:hypothetical protein